MTVRTLAFRVLAFVLAAVPVVWGTCPRWIAGDGFTCSLCVSGAAGTGDAAPRCPCCAAKTKSGTLPSDRTNREGCPVLEVRHTLTPAPTAAAVPPIDVTPLPFELLPAMLVMAPAAAPLAPVWDRSGGSPPLVGTVVLLI